MAIYSSKAPAKLISNDAVACYLHVHTLLQAKLLLDDVTTKHAYKLWNACIKVIKLSNTLKSHQKVLKMLRLGHTHIRTGHPIKETVSCINSVSLTFICPSSLAASSAALSAFFAPEPTATRASLNPFTSSWGLLGEDRNRGMAVASTTHTQTTDRPDAHNHSGTQVLNLREYTHYIVRICTSKLRGNINHGHHLYTK